MIEDFVQNYPAFLKGNAALREYAAANQFRFIGKFIYVFGDLVLHDPDQAAIYGMIMHRATLADIPAQDKHLDLIIDLYKVTGIMRRIVTFKLSPVISTVT